MNKELGVGIKCPELVLGMHLSLMSVAEPNTYGWPYSIQMNLKDLFGPKTYNQLMYVAAPTALGLYIWS